MSTALLAAPLRVVDRRLIALRARRFFTVVFVTSEFLPKRCAFGELRSLNLRGG